jgi:hypothetical protein
MDVVRNGRPVADNELGRIWKDANNQSERFIQKFFSQTLRKIWNFSVFISDLKSYLENPDYDQLVLTIHSRLLIKPHSQSVNEGFPLGQMPGLIMDTDTLKTYLKIVYLCFQMEYVINSYFSPIENTIPPS